MISIDLKAELNGLTNALSARVEIGEVASVLSSLNFSETSVVLPESALVFYRKEIAIRNEQKESPSLVTVTNKGELNGSLEKNAVVIGNQTFINQITLNENFKGVNFYLVPTSPQIEGLMLKNATLLILDEKLIAKSAQTEVALAFLNVMAKPLALIDYKINSYLSGKNAKSKWFNEVKRAVSIASKLTEYSNYKSAVLCAQAILMVVSNLSSVLAPSGEECVFSALKLCLTETSALSLKFTAIEKTAKLYHLFFSNDFSALLSAPDYASDVKLLSELTGNNANEYLIALKSPSNQRLKLVYMLIEKTRADFILETGAFLKALNGIKKVYLAITKQKGDLAVYTTGVKNAVTVAPYLSQCENVLTLLRDMGVLKCIN